MSPGRIVLIAFVTAFLIAGMGLLYIDVRNEPTDYYSITEDFNYGYAVVFALMGGLYLGPFVFFAGLMLYGLGYLVVFGLRDLLNRM
jgi:hypothetical protein